MKEKHPTETPAAPQKWNWKKQGLFYGVTMYVVMELLLPFFGEEGHSLPGILIGIPLWGIGGLVFGFFMKPASAEKGEEGS